MRFHLLAYPQTAADNLSVRVTDVRRQKAGDAAELLVSLQSDARGRRRRQGVDPGPFRDRWSAVRGDGRTGRRRRPSSRTIASRSRKAATGVGGGCRSRRTPTRRTTTSGLSSSSPRPGGRSSSSKTLRPPGPCNWPPRSRRTRLLKCTAEVVDGQSAGGRRLGPGVAPLVAGPASRRRRRASRCRRSSTAAVRRSSFPPVSRAPARCSAFGGRRGSIRRRRPPWRAGAAIEDLLAHTASGQPLPVGQLQIRKYCGLAGEVTPLATLRGGAPLLARVTTSRGAAYFCATTPAPADSSLATNGVVFYVLVQRAMAGGAAALGNTRQLTAGETPPDDPTAWKRVAGAQEALSTDYPVSPRHLPGWRAAAGGQPRRRRSVGAGAGGPPRGRPVQGP